MRVLKRKIPLFALVGLAFAVPALAQTGDLVRPGEPIPVACADSDVTPERNRRASDLFKTGKIAAENMEREKAIFYYLDAYRADCTGHAVLLKIAELWELKGNKVEALRYTQSFLDRAKADDPNRESATVRRDRLKRDIAAAPTASNTTPTATTSTTTTAPTATATATSTAVPTATATTTADGGGHTILPWVVTGVGGAVLITGGIITFLGAGKVSDAEAICPNHACPGTLGKAAQDAASQKGNDGRNQETIGIIIGSVGLAAIAGGLVWHFLEPTGPKPSTARLTPAITPQVAPGYAGVSVGGRF